MLYTVVAGPLGDMTLAGPRPDVLGHLTFAGQKYEPEVGGEWHRDDAAFPETSRQLAAYFAGDLKEFDLTVEAVGSEFRRRVWDALDAIPYGATVTYGGLAAAAGLPANAVRAVGGAVGHNPISVIRPCHRVVGANGTLTGYAGGVDRKRHLLSLEGVLPQGLLL
ncbi:methylated-DNA--[protein]-cysteine S-methyltransferase [Streptomyces spiramenti]|uniref:Methylated-DNA--protein-cysteine methyltransferase n=1 Tax=Streptomyces spiramenti TaxID=2720606 RepID=A0ABX1ADA4_9ACTN|nr:methylated-DNA--[protein]-cysteine S-methyltransferase [Streptomyces spiramenti]NJP65099.1 methylated-DNA--[protein]-cysteine S-methyltransferase [Streptomyces spiramenti]